MINKRDIKPPRFPERILNWYCGSSITEDLIGDMEEMYFINIEKMSVKRAKMKYWGQSLALLFSYALRRRKTKHRQNFSRGSMLVAIDIFRSYAKVAFRSLVKQRFFTIINTLGLSIGMSIGLLAVAAFMDILEVDDFQENGENIYRVITRVDDSNRRTTYASSSSPISEILKNEAPGIKQVVHINKSFNKQVSTGTKTIPLQGYYSDQSFFDVFSFSLVEGDLNSALEQPFSMVITRNTAEKLFYDTNPIGKVVSAEGLGEFQITGLLEDYHRSHFLFEVLVSYNTLELLENQKSLLTELKDWGPVTNDYTYLLLEKDARLSDIQNILDNVAGTPFEDNEQVKVNYDLQNLFNIAQTDYYNEIGIIWGYLTMTIFFLMSFLILIPACFNYTNISISRALKRTKEIGLRKVVGGQKGQIFSQFILETIIVSTISLLGGIYIFTLIRSEFLNMIVEGGKTFDFEITTETGFAFLGFALLTGIMAGLFPAIYFSRLNPIEALRKSGGTGKLSKLNIRKSLVVAQFTISLIFILGVAIVMKQYRYALNYDFGFDKENILDVQLKGIDQDNFRNEFSKVAEVSSISMSSSFPAHWMADRTFVHRPEMEDSLKVYQMFIDQHYLDNLKIDLVAGRNFPDESANDEEYMIVNEQFLKTFGIKNASDALDQSFIVENGIELRILGVVKDFNYASIRDKIESFFFRYNPGMFNYANVKLNSNDIALTIDKLDKTWKRISGEKKFEARFLNDEVEDSLVSFVSMVKIFGFLGFLAISISCLGLLAMVVFTAENRTKEMGIRKVMGASTINIIYIMAGSFVKLLTISVLIAVPLAYLFFDKVFLKMQYYRTNIGLSEILISVFLLFFLGLLTIFSQTYKTAMSNPVDSLKYE